MLEQARDLTVEAAAAALTRLTDSSSRSPEDIARLLALRQERENLSGMKCVMALVARGEDGSVYFADVIKNVTSSNGRVRALVLVYLQKYAEAEPDTALLAINSIQKMLGDKKPNSRAAAVRTLAGVKLPEIGLLLILCIKRAAADLAAVVRASAALAVHKAYEIDGINKKALFGMLGLLLSDDSVLVTGAALKVYAALKPEREKMPEKASWAPIHLNFKRIIRLLREMDEWAAHSALAVLVDYARRFLGRPYYELEGEIQELPDLGTGATALCADERRIWSLGFLESSPEWVMNPDLSSLVSAIQPLAYSTLSLLIISSVRLLLLIAPPEDAVPFFSVLVKLCSDPLPYVREVALSVVETVAAYVPRTFTNYRRFLVFPEESSEMAARKMAILVSCADEKSASFVCRELQHYAEHYPVDIGRAAVRALGALSQNVLADKILRWCLLQLASPETCRIWSDVLTVVRHILQEKSARHNQEENVLIVKTIFRLAQLLFGEHSEMDEDAKSSIVWIIGEFSETAENKIGPDVLRRLLAAYSSQPEKVRLELLMLAAKSYLLERQQKERATRDLILDLDQPESLVLRSYFLHTLHLASYDPSYWTRDVARMLRLLLLEQDNLSLAALLLQVPKPVPASIPTPKSSLGTVATWFTGELPPDSIRKDSKAPAVARVTSIEGKKLSLQPWDTPGPALTTQKTYKLQSLDEFLGSSEEDSESSVESSSESQIEESEESELNELDLEVDSYLSSDGTSGLSDSSRT